MPYPETLYLLSERSNPHSRVRANGVRFWGYPERRGGEDAITCIGVHTTEGDPGPYTARNTAKWQALAAPAPSSYHKLVDTATVVVTLADRAVAFHIVGLNTIALGISFGTRAHLWGRDRAKDEEMLDRGAQVVAEWSRKYVIPVRWITRAQALRGVRGFIRHSEADPLRRSDPGAAFPAARWFAKINRLLGSTSTERVLAYSSPMMHGADVEAFQSSLNGWLHATGRQRIEADGWFGKDTRDAASLFMREAMGVTTTDPRVGPSTLRVLAKLLEPTPEPKPEPDPDPTLEAIMQTKRLVRLTDGPSTANARYELVTDPDDPSRYALRWVPSPEVAVVVTGTEDWRGEVVTFAEGALESDRLRVL